MSEWDSNWDNIDSSTAGVDVQCWDFIIQAYRNLGKRYAVTGGTPHNGSDIIFPPPNGIYDLGVIDTATDNGDGTVTFAVTLNNGSVNEWNNVDGGDGTLVNRWVNYIRHGTVDGFPDQVIPWDHPDWLLVIEGDHEDPLTYMKAKINAQTFSFTGTDPDQTGSGTLTVDKTALNMVVAKFIGALSDLEGKNYYIIPYGGVWSDDRAPFKPSPDKEYWISLDSIGGFNLDLSVSADDEDTGEESLSCFWQILGDSGDNSKVSTRFTDNGSNTAKNTRVQITPASADVAFSPLHVTCIINDPQGLICYSTFDLSISRSDKTVAITVTPTTPPDSTPDTVVDGELDHAPTVTTDATATLSPTMLWGDGSDTTEYATITDYSSVTGKYSPSQASWNKDEWTKDTGYDVLIFDAHGFLHRCPIIHNDSRTLYIDPPAADDTDGTVSVGGIFCIVKHGKKGYPGRGSGYPFKWYAGYAESYYTHGLMDEISAAEFAAITFPESTGVDGDCSITNENAFDLQGVTIAIDSECMSAEAGFYYSPYIWQSIRGLQRGILDIIGNYIPHDFATSYRYIPPFNVATLMALIGANSSSSTVSVTSGTASFTVDTPTYDGHLIYYCVTRADGTQIINAQTPTAGVISLGTDETPTLAGLDVDWSAGFSLKVPDWVKYIYNTPIVFIPDDEICPGDGHYPALVVPANVELARDCDTGDLLVNGDGNNYYPTGAGSGAGTYIKRFKSTALASYNDNPGEGALGGELLDSAGPAFTAGHLIRHIGDNKTSSPIIPRTKTDNDFGPPPNLTYYDHCFRGTYSKTIQSAMDASKVGVITDSMKSYITDSTKNWWSDGVNSGLCRTDPETGTATNASPSTTILYDSVKDTTDHTKVYGSWWDTSRFAGLGTDPYVNFILEVDKTTDGSTTTFKAPIIATTQGAGGISITIAAVDGLTIENGDVYRIYETFCGSKWEDRDLIITKDDGTTITLPITHSDKESLFFTSQSTAPQVGWKYRIVEKGYGGVWKYDPSNTDTPTSKWEIPLDVHGKKRVQKSINETFRLDYGLMRCGDGIDTIIYKEIKDAIDALDWTTTTGGYYKSYDDAVGELWHKSASADSIPITGYPYGCYYPHFPYEDGDTEVITEDDIDYCISQLMNDDFFVNFGPGGIDYTPPNRTKEIGTGPTGNPTCYTGGGTDHLNVGGTVYDQGAAAVQEFGGYYKISGVSELFSSTAEFLNYAIAPGTDPLDPVVPFIGTAGDGNELKVDFNDFTEPVAWRTWTEFGEVGVSEGKAISNHITVPEVQPIKLWWDGSNITHNLEGFEIIDTIAIIKWDFSS